MLKKYVFMFALIAVMPIADAGAAEFASAIPDHERTWVGPEYWGNRLQDWGIANGRIECVRGKANLRMRTLHLLTHRVERPEEGFELSVKTGAIEEAHRTALTGFLVGVGRGDMDYRGAAIVHNWSGRGGGLIAGVMGNGSLTIGSNETRSELEEEQSYQTLNRKGWKVLGVDSAEPGNPGSNAVDGSKGTIWHTEWKSKKPGHPHEIRIDTGKVSTFNGIGYQPRFDNPAGRILKAAVYVSQDGESWGKPVAEGSFENTSKRQMIWFSEQKARYFKLVALSAHLNRPSTTVAELYALSGKAEKQKQVAETPRVSLENLQLTLKATPEGELVKLTLSAFDEKGVELASISRKVEAAKLRGGVALVSHPGFKYRFWFDDWRVRGKGIEADPSRTFGPIACAQHTLSRGTLKMTAQLLPVGVEDAATGELQIKKGGAWTTVAQAKVVLPGFTLPFRVENWDASRDTPYRIRYATRGMAGAMTMNEWTGTIRKDPVDKENLVVAGFTGNHNNSHAIGREGNDWITHMYFPHADLVEKVEAHKPDVLFFSGDQIYEGKSPTFADRSTIMLDYLYKWYLWCWAYRDLARDIPCITIPDDHDVFQGNIWGEYGRKSPRRDHHGGYVHPADFVKMVDRTQTSHLPDPWYKEKIGQGIGTYFTDMVYGRVGFAVIEDRKFKSGCAREGMPPSGTGRPDHFNDPKFDVARLDIEGVTLLGKEQLAFLDEFAGTWDGQDMKMAMSQTIFANMATHHGGGLSRLIADLDSNGWPQSGRNRAVAALRRGFIFHLAGDQHLSTIVHHGIEKHGDAMYSFCVPSICNFYPRAWAPRCGNPYVKPKAEEYLGDFRDGFKHPVRVYGATNPGDPSGHEPADLHDKMPGYGIVKLNRKERTITMECWPRYADPKDPNARQYEGWPRTIAQTDNYGREALAYLPTIKVKGPAHPVIQVRSDDGSELVYSLRIKGNSFRPKVFNPGVHQVRVGYPETGKAKVLSLEPPVAGKAETITVSFE